MNYAHIHNSKQSVSGRCLETLFCTSLLTSLPAEYAASLPLAAQKRCREATLRRDSQISRSRGSAGDIFQLNHSFLSKKVNILWKKAAKRVWKLLNIVLKSARVWDAGADGSGRWILWMSSSVSSRSISSTASVSELSRLVTHTAVSSPQCNSEKRPLSNNVAFRTWFK